MSLALNPNDYPVLNGLLNEMNKSFSKNKAVFNKRFDAWLLANEEDQNLRNELNSLVAQILEQVNFEKAFTDYGINSNRGFFHEIYLRLKHQILPVKLEADELKSIYSKLEIDPSRLKVLELIDVTNWKRIFSLIDAESINAQDHSKLVTEIYSALVVLTHRLTSIGIDPYFVSRIPEADDVDSPFFELNNAITEHTNSFKQKPSRLSESDHQVILEKLNRCDAILEQMEANEKLNGTSLHLIFLSKLAGQQLNRIRLLVALLAAFDKLNRTESQALLAATLVPTINRPNRLVNFLKANTQLLAHRVVNHTSEKGEHYVGFSRNENKKLFLSAMGGGLLVVLLVFIKHLIHALHLSLFFEGLLFGLNYAAGFVTMHLLHFTLATKQPAMTASYIASALDPSNPKSTEAKKAFRFVITSQFVSLIGNLIVVLPLCYFIGWSVFHFAESSIFSQEEAEASLYSNHPFLSLSLIYAGVTAIFLSTSGIITGLVDNKIQFSEIPYRIIHHPLLKKRIAPEKLNKIAAFVEKNGGAISGNIFLGLALGMAGNFGDFLGLPFDIRHITISAGNFGFATSSGWSFSTELITTVFFGVIFIGLINVIASFLISFMLACKSRNISFRSALKILFG
jgi:site-specific recombinase